MKGEIGSIKKILVIRFSSIGDIVLTTPVIRCLKKQLPHLELHFATKRSYAFILKNNPYIDKVHELESDYNDLADQLISEQFDLVLDLHHNLRTRKLKKALGVKSHSFFKSNVAKWLKVNFKIDRLPKKHIVDRYMETALTLGVENDGLGLDYFIPIEDEVNIEEIFLKAQSGFVAMAIGGQHETKKMPRKKLKQLCADIDKPIVLLGGKEDAKNGAFIASENALVYNACGMLNLNQSASVCKQATCVITHDTGMMHISAAFDKQIISLWGNTIPEFGMYPYMPEQKENNFQFEVKGLSCRPCSKIGFDKCPKGHHKCMEHQNLSQIAQKVDETFRTTI